MTRLRTLGSAAIAALVATTAPALAQDYYEGKTIKCVVPYAPGGGTDAFFRVIVPHLSRLIPGEPDIIINNMDGAGGLKANNYAANEMPDDGTEMLCAPWLAISQITQRDGVRFDYSRMRVVGGEGSINTSVINKDTMIDGDRTTVGQGPQRVVVAGLSPSSTLDMRQRIGFDILGIDHIYVPGYRGSAKQIPAFLSGEVSVIGLNYGTYAATMKEALETNGPGMLFVNFDKFDSDGNIVREPIMEDLGIPNLSDLYAQMNDGAAVEGPLWEAYKVMEATSRMGLSVWLPGGAPDEAFEALKTGWEALPDDPDFVAAHEKAFGKPVSFVTYGDALQAQKIVGEIEPDMVTFFQDYIAEGER